MEPNCFIKLGSILDPVDYRPGRLNGLTNQTGSIEEKLISTTQVSITWPNLYESRLSLSGSFCTGITTGVRSLSGVLALRKVNIANLNEEERGTCRTSSFRVAITVRFSHRPKSFFEKYCHKNRKNSKFQMMHFPHFCFLFLSNTKRLLNSTTCYGTSYLYVTTKVTVRFEVLHLML